MTQENQTLASAMEAPQPQTKRWNKAGPTLIMSLLAVALAIGAVAYEIKANRQLRKDLVDAGKWQTELQQTRQQLQQLDAKLTLNDVRQTEVAQQQSALTRQYENLTLAESARSLAEIEQMLIFASQQLQLTGNPSPAIAALGIVEQRLAALNQPEFINLRRAVQKELDALHNLPVADLSRTSAQLDSLIETTDKLPLAIDTRRTPIKPAPQIASEADKLSRIAQQIWHDFKQLVQIRRMDKPDAVLLTQEQAFFLRENIKLRLLNARAALLSRDEKIFRTEISAVQGYLTSYFDLQAPALAHTQNTLKQLTNLPLNQQMPDLASSLNAVRSARQQSERIKP